MSSEATVRVGDVWLFDVDGTLIGSVRSDVLRPGARELLARLGEHGVTCVLWSAGGSGYAQRMAERHGIGEMFVACYDKGERDADGRYTVAAFADDHRPDVFVDDAPLDMPVGATVVSVAQFIGGNSADRALWDLLARLTTASQHVRTARV